MLAIPIPAIKKSEHKSNILDRFINYYSYLFFVKTLEIIPSIINVVIKELPP